MNFGSPADRACHAALEQRVRLLSAVWGDVQGEQRAVRQGALPDRLLVDVVPARGPLDTYSADLMGCPDGVWRVTRDHVGQHPGAGLLEAPILAPFLPGLCRLLLGETLQMVSLPVWWLGDVDVRPILAAGSARLFVRDGLSPQSEVMVLAELPAERRSRLQVMVDADPGRFIAGLMLGRLWPMQQVIWRAEMPSPRDLVLGDETFEQGASEVEALDEACAD